LELIIHEGEVCTYMIVWRDVSIKSYFREDMQYLHTQAQLLKHFLLNNLFKWRHQECKGVPRHVFVNN